MNCIDVEELRRLYVDENLTVKEVAQTLGISVGTAFNRLKKYGIPPRKGMRPDVKERWAKVMSEKMRGRKRPPFTEEHKRRISESKKGVCRVFSDYGGHLKRRKDGYVYVFCPNHPYASKDGYVMEHILVMEEQVGYYITRDYVVHHKNGIRNDNRIENLELMTFKNHASLHLKMRREKGLIKCHHVSVINTDTGEIFESVVDAGKKYSVKPTNISRACRNERRTVRGFHWKYAN